MPRFVELRHRAVISCIGITMRVTVVTMHWKCMVAFSDRLRGFGTEEHNSEDLCLRWY